MITSTAPPLALVLAIKGGLPHAVPAARARHPQRLGGRRAEGSRRLPQGAQGPSPGEKINNSRHHHIPNTSTPPPAAAAHRLRMPSPLERDEPTIFAVMYSPTNHANMPNIPPKSNKSALFLRQPDWTRPGKMRERERAYRTNLVGGATDRPVQCFLPALVPPPRSPSIRLICGPVAFPLPFSISCPLLVSTYYATLLSVCDAPTAKTLRGMGGFYDTNEWKTRTLQT